MPPKKQEYVSVTALSTKVNTTTLKHSYKKKEQDHVINILLRDDDIVPLLEGDYEQPANVSLVPLLEEGDYEQPANVLLVPLLEGDYEQPANVSLIPLLEGDYEQPANVSLVPLLEDDDDQGKWYSDKFCDFWYTY
ncbi:12813_t:CDS:2 [Rhizophagus irregularis]|nr:12813_t:CDS:2 [Rhizophagus irregularis]